MRASQKNAVPLYCLHPNAVNLCYNLGKRTGEAIPAEE